MELIIKPTAKCNMCCDFCAASNIKCNEEKTISSKILDIIDRISPDNLIFTGGDPLCVEPEYYEMLLEKYPDKHIDMTTNLKDFYINPDKWKNVLRHPNVSVCTSFNYGNTRKWSHNEVYTEDMFKRVMDKFSSLIGYVPPFISVIDKDNYDTVFDTVYLAKDLGTKCRINNAMKMGRQGVYFPRYKVFQKWLEIIENGLEEYEITCSERKYGKCPINSNLLCSSTIRAVYVDSNDNLFYTDCEDKLNLLEDVTVNLEQNSPLVSEENISLSGRLINEECSFCELFRVCNGCKTNRKQAIEYCPEYCSEMKKLKDRIIKTRWKL